MGRKRNEKRKSIKIKKRKRRYFFTPKTNENPNESSSSTSTINQEITQEQGTQRSQKNPQQKQHGSSSFQHNKTRAYMMRTKKIKEKNKPKAKQKLMKVLIKERFKLLSPTSMRPPKLNWNQLDEADFNKFSKKLKTKKFHQLNSTSLSAWDSPKPKSVLTENSPNVIQKNPNPDLVKIDELLRSLDPISPESTLEDGEIRTLQATGNYDDNHDDDDCICVEEEIEQIVIDDTEENPKFFKDTSKMRIIDLTPKTERKSFSKKSKKKSSSSSFKEEGEVILLDDTVTEPLPEPKAVEQSVVFVSETLPDFIPLVSDNVPKPLKVPSYVTPKNQRNRDSLFSKSEKKQLESYNVNAYNPNAELQVKERRQNPKRMVIIDGSNVAFAHGRSEVFSVKGLQICIEYFKKMGHEVKVVVPLYRLHKMKSTNPQALEEMHKSGLIVLTPCKNLPGLSASSYDDRFILQLASEFDAAIVSNDNYRDLIHENTAFKKLIKHRVIGYSWCDDVFMLPKDPYGQFGPTLHSILNREVDRSGS